MMFMKERVRKRTIDAALVNRQDIKDFMDSDADMRHLFELPTAIPEERVALYKKLYMGVGNTPCYTVHLPNDNILRVKMSMPTPWGITTTQGAGYLTFLLLRR